MTPPDPETRFLAALAQAAAVELGADHPLASGTTDGRDALLAQEQLAALPEATRERLLAAAHRLMREDLAAIWSFLPGAVQSGGMMH
ncbi:hypothetical protein IQ03_02044 [Gemmobacter caeni]|uniref:Uncharacterized protein n=1 Tax=Gemmobacter caeni TaxID=589035 RepID=A0A2T6B054_9RHOB|nr:hypothetical protein [Gemmobacter caeni]PTX49383.1 hypothetical protein C8N34_10730 [Gemmobacter caeni]TWJ00320.1 hypothetical protein IQ03_02044 [Gemmobacter caeni]